MIGYWSHNCPVKTSDDRVLATVYQQDKKALVAIASWAPDSVSVHLQLDWKKLGIDPARAIITAPAIPNFQPAVSINPMDALPVSKGRGWLLIISQK